MITCANCGTKLPKHAVFCGHCGQKIEKVNFKKQSKHKNLRTSLAHAMANRKIRYVAIALIIIIYTYVVYLFVGDNSSAWESDFSDTTYHMAVKDTNGYTKNLYFRVHPSSSSVYFVDNRTDATNGVFYKGLSSNYNFSGNSLEFTESQGKDVLTIYLKDLDTSGNGYTADAQVTGGISGILNGATFANSNYQQVTIKEVK